MNTNIVLIVLFHKYTQCFKDKKIAHCPKKDPWVSKITLNFSDTDQMKKYHVVLKTSSIDGAV